MRLLLLLFLFSGLTTFAQVSFDWLPNDSIVTTVHPTNYTELKIEQVNQTGDTLNLETEMIYKDIPAGWDGMICVEGLCLGGIPAVGFVTPMAAISGPTNGYARWTVSPQGIDGTGEIHIRIYDADNPTDGDTAVWIVTSEPLGIQDYDSAGDFVVYPNPANDFISISNGDGLDQMMIYTPDGKLVKQYAILSELENIDISNLPTGLYFVHGLRNGTLIGTRKIIKE